MKISGVYKIQSTIKPERIYIGSAVDIKNRFRIHRYDLRWNKHSSKKLQNHCNKYGSDDLLFSIVTTCAQEDLISLEQFFMQVYKAIDSSIPWFNIRPLAQNNLGFKHSEESKAKIRHPLSEETKKLMSESRRGHPSGMLGKRLSEEHKQKLFSSRRGIPAWSKGTKGLVVSWNKTPICQYDKQGNFIKDWECAMYAGRELSIDNGNIGYVLKSKRKTAGKFVWKYKNTS